MADAMRAHAVGERRDPLLFTPGPLTTSARVKAAMARDWGSRDQAFLTINREVLEQLALIVNGGASHVTVPVPGSGTFAVEAMLTTLVPRTGKVLVLSNGVYGERARRMCEIAGRAVSVHSTAEDAPPDLARVARLLEDDRAITHLFIVHCETTSGILNPLAEVAMLAARHRVGLLVDAMSTFGALPLDAAALGCLAIAASSNKCLEGVPGLGFVVCRRAALEECRGNATTLSFDLFEQWQGLRASGQYRFTPPTHVIAALHQALAELRAEGGPAGRVRRYRRNCEVLVAGMRELGFVPLLDSALQAPIIVTFPMPEDRPFAFAALYERLAERGYVIYPGKLTRCESFRIGCIGRLDDTDMRGLVLAIATALEGLGRERAGAERRR
jgi:2-aminoethylphosphonate-pyruvate transaminase